MQKIISLFSSILICLICAKAFSFEQYYLYQPKGPVSTQRALLVLLHGCDQTALDIFEITQIQQYADDNQFYVLLPQQNISSNIYGCWNWFLRVNQGVQGYEPLSIVEMVEETQENFKIDDQKIYALGLSAGGAMSGILLRCFPEVFSAAVIHSGVSFLRAQNSYEGLKLIRDGPDGLPPSDLCIDEEMNPLMVISGDQDQVIHPENLLALREDFYSDYYFEILIPELGHAWSGGLKNRKYSDPNSRNVWPEILNFLNL